MNNNKLLPAFIGEYGEHWEWEWQSEVGYNTLSSTPLELLTKLCVCVCKFLVCGLISHTVSTKSWPEREKLPTEVSCSNLGLAYIRRLRWLLKQGKAFGAWTHTHCVANVLCGALNMPVCMSWGHVLQDRWHINYMFIANSHVAYICMTFCTCILNSYRLGGSHTYGH